MKVKTRPKNWLRSMPFSAAFHAGDTWKLLAVDCPRCGARLSAARRGQAKKIRGARCKVCRGFYVRVINPNKPQEAPANA